MTHNRIVEAVVEIAKTLNDGAEIKSTGNRLADALESIADGLGGETDQHTGNRIADALEVIADNVEAGGGGGNPNSIESLPQSTLSNPWNGRAQEIIAKIKNPREYTVLVGSGGLFTSFAYDSYDDVVYWSAWYNDLPDSGSVNTSTIRLASYNSEGSLLQGVAWYGNSWTSMDRNFKISITIIHHPLP